MLEPRRSACRRHVRPPRGIRALAVAFACLAGGSLAAVAWRALAADATVATPASAAHFETFPLAQPSWYYTQEDLTAAPPAAPLTAAPADPAAALAQPSFIAPLGATAEAPKATSIPIDSAFIPSGESQPAMSDIPQDATTETPVVARLRMLWQQVAGPQASPGPNTQPIDPKPGSTLEQGNLARRPALPGEQFASAANPPTGADQRPLPPSQPANGLGIELPRAATGLIQQVVGAAPVAAESTAIPDGGANVLRSPTVAASSAPLMPLPAVAPPSEVPPARNATPYPATTASANLLPAQPPSAPPASVNVRPPTNVPQAPAAYAGDPVLNTIADFAARQELPTNAVNTLFQPLVQSQPNQTPPNTPTTPTTPAVASAAPVPNAASPPPLARFSVPYPMTATPAPIEIPEPTITAPDGHPIFLEPFYQTNVRPSGDPNAGATANNTAAPPTIKDALVASPFGTLVRQFALSTNDDLRKPPASATPAFLPEQRAWDGGWATSNRADAALVAYLQETEAIPEPVPADLEMPNAPGQPGEEAESLAQAERLGEEPEDNTLQFLRTNTVLLEPGESQCDVGLYYALTEADFPLLLSNDLNEIVGVGDAQFRIRTLAVPIEYRLGLTKRVQGFIGMPVGWSNTQINVNTFEDFRNDGGVGDVNFGLTIQLNEAAVDKPYWVTTLSATAPAGGSPFANVVGIAPSAPSLGQGFWSLQGNLLFIQPYDPVVVFYGLGMQRYFESRYGGIDIEPGSEYSYTLGVGFGVSDRVTLSSRFRGAYLEETEANGVRVPGTNQEPMTLRFAATISKPCNRIVEPFIEFGLTDDSVSSFFGVTWTFQPTKNQAEAAAKREASARKP